MRICVIGAGSIGGVIASGLAGMAPTAGRRTTGLEIPGLEITVLARGATLAAITRDGLRVEAPDGTVTVVPVTASDSAADLGVQDVAIVAVKAQSMPSVAATIGPLLGPSTAVLSTLNGVPWWFLDGHQGFGGAAAGAHLDSVDPGGRIAAVLPVSRVIGGTVHLSASSPAPGVVRWRAGNRLIIGEPDGAGTPRLTTLGGVLRAAGFDVMLSSHIRDDVWYKLWGNLTLNPVCAITGSSAGPALDDDLVREFCSAAMLEAREIGARIGCPIAQTPQDRHAVTRKLGDFVPSMLQDAEAGRPLELDALTGAVRELGLLVGVPTPYTDALHGLARVSVGARAHAAADGPGNP